MIRVSNRYQFEKDVHLIAESLDMPLDKIAKQAGIPESSFFYALSSDNPSKGVLEPFYSFAYGNGLRLNKAKEEIFGEALQSGEILLFHGSSEGLAEIDPYGSKPNCDFSNGFYCGESYSSALCFVEGDPDSSVYAFKANLQGLRMLEFHSDLEWMLTICHHRLTLRKHGNSKRLLDIIEGQKGFDVIVAPIADNRMYRVMQQFASGQISDLQAIHALSASRLGRQYVFKTDEAVSRLREIERMYLSAPEKKSSKAASLERANEIQTKLDLSKREYRGKGLYIDEVFA